MFRTNIGLAFLHIFFKDLLKCFFNIGTHILMQCSDAVCFWASVWDQITPSMSAALVSLCHVWCLVQIKSDVFHFTYWCFYSICHHKCFNLLKSTEIKLRYGLWEIYICRALTTIQNTGNVILYISLFRAQYSWHSVWSGCLYHIIVLSCT